MKVNSPLISPPLKLPRAILFDMDGTLTQPLLDFDLIRRDIGISGGILETISKMNHEDQLVAESILRAHEDRAAQESKLNSGCTEILKWIESVGIQMAIVTRNSRRSVDIVFRQHGLNFQVCITREDGKYKPDPAPLRLACDQLKVEIADAWMVGDGYHDIEAGVAAGMRTMWISHGSKRNFAAEPTHAVRDLIELRIMLEKLRGGAL